MPHLLLTNMHLREFGGSEMVSLELAEEFIARGWKVDVFASVIGEPFASEFKVLQDQGLHLSSDPDDFGSNSYDLLWVHHSMIPRSAVQRILDGASSPRIVWNHMSAFAELELPMIADIESRASSIITFVSPEARSALQMFGLPDEKCQLLQNPAPRAFLTAEPQLPAEALRTVLLVSNHPPEELDAAVALLEEKGISVLRVGGGNPQRMTPSVLQQADAVVTIGKTTQYALCIGIPVYEYDHFGGCGWITHSNFEAEFRTNFSGRSTQRVLTAEDIVLELQEGYKSASEFASAEITSHREFFSLERRVDLLLKDIDAAQQPIISGEDLRRWKALSTTLTSLYSNLMLESDRVREQMRIVNNIREEKTQLSHDLHARISDEVSARTQLVMALEAAEESLANSQKRISALENSKALRLGQAILSPIYRLQRFRNH